ncbi:MAG: carboxypeptidase-like regulatory domain-containing protein [Bacteroidota bacterium]
MTRILLLFLLSSTVALAQHPMGKLSGRIVDDLGDPLPGANVIIEGTRLGASADDDGNYFVIGIPAGTYDVTASFVGFEHHTVEAIQISSGYTTEQSFELGMTNYFEIFGPCLDCWGYEPLISTDPFASRRISGEEIEHMPIGR